MQVAFKGNNWIMLGLQIIPKTLNHKSRKYSSDAVSKLLPILPLTFDQKISRKFTGASSHSLHFQSIKGIRKAFESAQLSKYDFTSQILMRARLLQKDYKFFINICDSIARDDAILSEKTKSGLGNGVTFHIKDHHHYHAMVPTTNGSLAKVDFYKKELLLQDHHSPLVQRLKYENSIFLGTTATPEFGLKGDTSSRLMGITRNPHDYDKSVGGSSGGAAGAIAAGIGHIGIAGDGAGSVRIPATLNGVVGFKPRADLVIKNVPTLPPPNQAVAELRANPVAPSHLIDLRFGEGHGRSASGIVTRTVEDCAIAMDILCDKRMMCQEFLDKSLENWKIRESSMKPTIVYLKSVPYAHKDIDMMNSFNISLEKLKQRIPNARWIEIEDFGFDNPAQEAETWWYQLLQLQYTSPIMAKAIKQDALKYVDSHILTSLEFWKRLGADERKKRGEKALNAFVTVKKGIDAIFANHSADFILTPAMPSLAWTAGIRRPKVHGLVSFDAQKTGPVGSDVKYLDFAWNPYLWVFNWSDNAAITIPSDFLGHPYPLPIGIQLVIKRPLSPQSIQDTTQLLGMAGIFESILDVPDIFRPIFPFDLEAGI